MNVLVTGGSGFIGAAVVEACQLEGHNVTVLDRTMGQDVRFHAPTVAAIYGMDAVIHLAGILGTDELFDNVQDAIDVNITGSVNVLDGCVEHGAKYIGITMLPVFPSIYTATKVSAGRFATAYYHNYGVPITHVRAFNVFGAKQHHGDGHPRKIIPAFSVEGWQQIPMKIWGDGQQMVDLIDVDEVARVFVDALDAPGKDEIIDAGTGRGWTVNEVADFVLDVTGSAAGVKHLPMRRGEIPTKVVSYREGWEHLSFTPTCDPLKLIKAICAYKDWA